MRSLSSLALLAALLSTTSCAARPEAWVELAGQRIHVELALTEPQRQQGLMFRESLPERQGMLFVFERPQPLAFWMKNTLIPLDILYFDADRQLVSVSRDVPPCKSAYCPSYPSAGPALYTLELNAGQAAALGVKRGDEIVFGPGIPSLGSP